MRRHVKSHAVSRTPAVAASGLLDRRAFLTRGATIAAGFTVYAIAPSAGVEPLKDDPWSLGPGNKVIGENDVMNATTLPKVRMPNRDGFIVRFPEKI